MGYRVFAIVVMSTYLVLPLHGGPLMPDKLNLPVPPALWPNVPVPKHTAPIAVPDPAGPMTAERMNTFVVSAPLREALLREIAVRTGTLETIPSTPASPATPHQPHLRGLHPGTFTEGFGSTTNLTNDGTFDQEPTIRSVLKGSVIHTATVDIRYPDRTHAHLYSYHSTSLPAFDGPHDLAIPAGYSQAGDPYLAANGYTTGIHPGRLYCVGALFNDNGGSGASAIAVWSSDDGGATWPYAPAIIASANGGGHLLDKPNIAVSDFGGSPGVPSTRGYVFVTWVDVNTNSVAASAIKVAVSTNGGSTFSTPTALNPQYVQFPQVLVNAYTGALYVIWTNLNLRQLVMASSTNNGTTFSAEETVASAHILAKNTPLARGVTANSIPAARFDWPANRIVLVYTGSGTAPYDAFTDVYYTYKVICQTCSWQAPTQVNYYAQNDQFMPGIDINGAGEVLVAYYDRRDDPLNYAYREYLTHMTADGVQLYESGVPGLPASDPAARNVGDYQDVWDDYYFDGESASVSWIGFPVLGQNDLYLTRFFYR